MRRVTTVLTAICLFAGSAWADARGDLEAGKAAYARGDDLAAVAQFGSAIDGGLQGPDLAEAHRERGRSYLRMGDLVKAARDLNKAIEMSPQDGEAHGLRCLVNLGLNNGKRAVADAEAAFARTQTSVPAHVCRGEILYAARNFKQSLTSFDEAMRLGANDYQFRTSRALAMIWAGKPDEAMQELNLLIDASRGVAPSTRAKLFEARARARLAKSDLDGALADAAQAIEISDAGGVLEAERHAFRARLRVLKADFDGAIADLDEALKLLTNARDDRVAALYAMRAGANASRGQLERAVSDFDEAIRRGKEAPAPQVATWHVGRARANVALGRRPAAGEDFARAVQLDPKNPEILIERGDNRLYQGEPAAALADYQAALTLDPSSVPANSRIGWALLDQGQYEPAIAAASKVIQLRPDSGLGYWDRGVFRFLAGRFAEADADFRRVVELTPKNMHAMMWGHFARARAGQGGTDVLARQAQGVNMAEWPGPVLAAVAGTSSPEAAVGATQVDEPGRRRRREAEAHFYLGELALTRGDTAAAEEHFRKAVATDVREFVEYTASRIELQRMGR